MRKRPEILWIGPHASDATSGEAIYDRKLARGVEDCADLAFDMPQRVGKAAEIAALAIGTPWYRARYRARATIRRLREKAQKADLVICSWEPLDFLAPQLGKPVVLVLHNITSDALPEFMPDSVPARLLAKRAHSYEKKTYNAPAVKAILTLSRRDQRLVQELGVTAPVLWCPPGAPPAVALNEDARFLPALTVSGSIGWRVKERDLSRFLSGMSEAGMAVFSDDPLPDTLPPGMQILPAQFEDANYCAAHIRIGIIADRFVAGHKLKATFYIAHNAVVFSYADIREEFAGLPYAEKFVRHVTSATGIRAGIAELQAMSASQLHAEFAAFRAACLYHFSWTRAAGVLREAITLAGSNIGIEDGSYAHAPGGAL